jgi:hypothetical protein
MVHRLRKRPFLVGVALLAVTIAHSQVDKTGLKPAEWGKVDRKAAIATALRVLDLNTEFSGDASAAVALRNGEGKFTVGRRKGEIVAIYLKIGEWDFRFTPRTGGLLSAKRPQLQEERIETPQPAARLQEAAQRFIEAAGLKADSTEIDVADSELKDRQPVVQMLVRAYHNGLWATLQPQIGMSSKDCSLVNFDVRTDMDFDSLSHEKRVSFEVCQAAALDAYLRFRPYRNSIVASYAGVVGVPLNSEGKAHEMTARHLQLIESRVGIPMYRFVFADAGYSSAGAASADVYVPRQVISVDMLTGRAITVFDGGEPLGGTPAKLSPFNKGLDHLGSLSVVGRQGEGKAKALPTTRTDEPAGAKVFVRSGKVVITAKLDVKGLLWTFDGKLWHAFKPDAALAKAARAAAAVKLKPFGGANVNKENGKKTGE